MLITSKKNTFTATSSLVFEQTFAHHNLAKLTYKINQHLPISSPGYDVYFLIQLNSGPGLLSIFL